MNHSSMNGSRHTDRDSTGGSHHGMDGRWATESQNLQRHQPARQPGRQAARADRGVRVPASQGRRNPPSLTAVVVCCTSSSGMMGWLRRVLVTCETMINSSSVRPPGLLSATWTASTDIVPGPERDARVGALKAGTLRGEVTLARVVTFALVVFCASPVFGCGLIIVLSSGLATGTVPGFDHQREIVAHLRA